MTDRVRVSLRRCVGDTFEIDGVILDGQWLPVSSPKLDAFCRPSGDLELPGIVLVDWRDRVRQEPS